MPQENVLFGVLSPSIVSDVVDTLPIPMISFNSNLEAVYFNTAFVEYVELDRESVTNLTEFSTLQAMDMMPEFQPDGQYSEDTFIDLTKKAAEEGPQQFPWMIRSFKGKSIPTRVSIVVNEGDKSKYINCYFIYAIDILKENSRAMFDSTPLAMTLWDSKYALRDANAFCHKFLGYETQEDFMQNYRKCLPILVDADSATRPELETALAHTFKEGYNRVSMDIAHNTNIDATFCEVTFVRLNLWNEEMVVMSIRDLSDRSAIIDEMQCTEARIQAILDINPLGINVWDHSFNLIDCNAAIVQLYGFEDKKTYLAAQRRVFPRLQPDGSRSIYVARDAIQHTFDHGNFRLEMLTYDVNANPIPVEIICKKAQIRGQDVVIAYVRDLRNFNAMIAEINATQQELRIARDLAEQSAQTKSVFLGNMSHEIRTPLNGVVGLLHVLKTTSLQPIQQDFVEKAITSADNLLNVLNDVLDFSKIETGTFIMQRKPFTLQGVVDEIKVVFEQPIKDKNLGLNIFIDESGEEILYGDGQRLKQVLFNIIKNAVAFTEEGHISINISCSKREKGEMHFLFSVEDTGIGMSKSQSLKVFSAFNQADSSITRKHGGTGLGLTIARNIVKIMDGDMWVKSQKGEGSTFYFTAVFKIRTEGKETAEHLDEHDAMDEQMAMIAPVDIEHAEIEEVDDNEVKPCAGNILLVEDNEISQLIISELLKNKGYDVDIACNGQHAVDMVKSNKYDMVLMDIQMPVMDGLTATTKIRGMKKFAELPIVAMSAHAMAGDKTISLEHGMNDHLPKPTLPEVLFAAVEKWINKKD